MSSESVGGISPNLRSASEVLCSNLSDGLHAVAQPLTILRASLSNPDTDRMSAGELRELTAISAVEVERVCKLFDYLRDLVCAENTKAHLSSTPILPFLSDVVDGVRLLCVKDGILLNSIMPDSCRPVFIDRARTLQAFSSALLIARGVSQSQDTVEVIVTSQTSSTVQVVVRNLNSCVESMNAETRLDLALAEANIRSQQANFSCSLEPFSIRIELPCTPIIDSH
jgi:hypothetical protein